MERIVVLGKGGVGKSTIVSNLGVIYALDGLRVLNVGCDPKHDSSISLVPGNFIETFMEKQLRAREKGRDYLWDREELLVRGRLGIDCVEAGGPEPGVGCAGRGISLMLDAFMETNLLEQGAYDVCLFDVLGDVVCGGFAAPLRMGFGEKLLIVVSEELMSLYAANNIARAVKTYAANGVFLAGLAANVRDGRRDRSPLEHFAKMLDTRILEYIPRDPTVREAEYRGEQTAVELSPASPFSRALRSLAEKLLAMRGEDCPVPTPMADRRFYARWREKWTAEEG